MGKKSIALLILLFSVFSLSAEEYRWKVGVARSNMTPEKSRALGGFEFRDRPAEGALHDLWIKVLAVEDAQGNRAVLITAEMVGFVKPISDRIRNRLKNQFNLSKSQIILNASHTHSGPVIMDELHDYYMHPFDEEEIKLIQEYTDSLENNIIACVERAIHSMRPAQIFTGNGLTRFQVNRRNNIEANISDVSELKGPHDPAVPVIKIEDLSGQIIAVVFGYACHPSVLKGYYFSGDYAGFAQEELQEIYPGTETLFFQGAGGDIAAFPRETIPLAKQYGKELAIAVESVLNSDMERQPATLRTVYEEIDLPLSEPPTEEELKNLIDSHTDYVQVWARRMMAELMEKGNLINSYPFYPLQIWLLGNQPIFGLGGEPVIEYALELKRMYGNNVFVMGYANDVMAYIPSTRILQEGGYEGATSQMYFQNMPSSWDPSIELRIITAIENMSRDLGLTKLQRKIIRNNP